MNLATLLQLSRNILALQAYKVDIVFRRGEGKPIEESHITVHNVPNPEEALIRARFMCTRLGWILEAAPVVDLHPAFAPPAKPAPSLPPEDAPIDAEALPADAEPMSEDVPIDVPEDVPIDVPPPENAGDDPDAR